MYKCTKYDLGTCTGVLFALLLVIRSGFEPETHSLEGCCSIQLSYQTRAVRQSGRTECRQADIKATDVSGFRSKTSF